MQHVEIRIKGHIDRDWSDWISDSTVAHTRQGETVLTGQLRDEAALYGLLAKLSDLGMQLLSLSSERLDAQSGQGGQKDVRA